MPDTPEKTEGKDDPLKEARERYEKAAEYWSNDREAARDDIRFRAGQQWPQEIVKQRETDKRPCLTVDKLNQFVRQIVNDGRQNRPSIKVRPVAGGADAATSEIFAGIIKHIEDISCADAAYDTALDSAATCGFGFFRVLTDYVGDDTFDQEIYIRRVRNPLSVIIDPMAIEADGSDMRYAYVVEDMDKEEFERLYPDASPSDWEGDATKYGDWFGETVRVAEYWWVEETARKLYKLGDGSVINEEKFKAANAVGLPLDVVETREIPQRVVKWCKMSGAAYLEEPKTWPGKYIPIMVVWGNEIDIEGEVIHSGIIRPGKDAQRLYNYSRSAFAERVALTPKAPWVAAEGQVEDYANEWSTANTLNHSVLKYKPVSLNGSPVPPPQRQSAADIPSGFQADMQLAEHDIQAAIGMYSSSLGAPSNERSGKAIMARQKEGDTGTFHYHDNLNRAIRYCGKVLVDLIPKIYDSTRVVRLLGYDGALGEASLDPTQATASRQEGLRTFYNLGVGTYDVTISSGPSYNTLRVEAATSMMELIQASPELMGIIGDLAVKNMDWPQAQEISERLRLALPPEIKAAEDAKKQSTIPPEAQQIIQTLQQQLEQKDASMGQAADLIHALKVQIEDAKVDKDIEMRQLDLKEREIQIKEFDARTKRMQAGQIEGEDGKHIEILKLQYEDRWKKLETQARVLVAEIAADAKVRSDQVRQEAAEEAAEERSSEVEQ